MFLNEEIESLKTFSFARDASHLSFMYPKSKWYPLFHSLFYKDKDTYMKTVKELTKWYRKKVIKDYTNERGYRYDVGINIVLLATLKIASAYKGLSFQIEDEFLPKELLTLE